MEKKDLLSTRQVAELLKINEKMVYTLISEKGLPATKITGKWLFPLHLVKQWVENETINYPKETNPLPPYHGLVIISGSNDILLDRLISKFNGLYAEHIAVFGNLGSLGGIRALRQNLCHIASSHLMQDNEQEYNFDFALEELGQLPAVVNFCQREQGILLSKGNPKGIQKVADLGKAGMKIANRPMGTGTRKLFDVELEKAGIRGDQIDGYDKELQRHMDVGLEILSGKADAAPGIRSVAGLLGLDFMTLRWERFDFLILKERFFDQGVQLFLRLLHEPLFRDLAQDLEGYDLGLCGKVIFPQQSNQTRGLTDKKVS
ncbi:MAG: helix-turn-helix transcriptional regulator [Deltaproteobacteria bacterium]|nr:helix-turn-helix transcriptional regulator [Deltaproteobacteria bacterium]